MARTPGKTLKVRVGTWQYTMLEYLAAHEDYGIGGPPSMEEFGSDLLRAAIDARTGRNDQQGQERYRELVARVQAWDAERNKTTAE